jgi:peptide/nickel transport system permease protein
MRVYIAKRSLLFIPTLIIVTLVVFAILRVVPGDPAVMILMGEEGSDESFTQEQLDALRAKLGTDKPIYVQYIKWVGNMLRGDFGISYFYEGEKVVDDIKGRLPVTIELGLLSMILASIVAIPLGIISAVKQDTIGDYVTRVITIAGIALPNFWVAIMMIFFLVLFFNWAPPLAYLEPWEDPWTNIQQLIFPAIALGTSNMAFVARITRSAMLEVLHEDYIRTARSKGLRERVVVFRHALRNALLPVITTTGLSLAYLISGAVIVESVFEVQGLGFLMLRAAQYRDYATLQSMVLIIGALVMVINLLTDIAYGWIDPRIRYS